MGSALGLPGAILGFFIGLFAESMFKDSPGQLNRRQHQEHQQLFFQTIFQLLGHLAKADGRVSEAEIKSTEAIMTRMGLSSDKRADAIAFFKAGTSTDFNLDVSLQNFRVGPGRSRQMKQFLIVSLLSMSMADGHMDTTEQRLISRIADGIGMSRMQLQQLIMMLEAQHNFFRGRHQHHRSSGGAYQSPTPANELKLAYQALGIKEGATDTEIKKAYRSLMKEYHPDKLIAKGLPEDMVKVATEKAQEVQAAYNLIKSATK